MRGLEDGGEEFGVIVKKGIRKSKRRE